MEKIKGFCYSLFNEHETKVMAKEKKKEKIKDKKLNNGDATNVNVNFLCDYDSFINDMDDVGSKSELNQYLKEKVLPKIVDFDILNW